MTTHARPVHRAGFSPEDTPRGIDMKFSRFVPVVALAVLAAPAAAQEKLPDGAKVVTEPCSVLS